jgi:hypothetical protein
MATPYVVSSDLVSAYPAKSLEIAQYIDGFKADLALVQNAQTGTTYSFVAADFTKLVTLSNASPVAVTLPDEATVAWPAGTQLRLLNQGAGTVTVAGAVGVTINGTPLTLAQYKGAALIKTGTDTWTFAPFSSGSAAATVSSTTGSPTITTVNGKTVYVFNASGTMTIASAGTCQVLVQAGGGGGGVYGGGGGGAGGQFELVSAYVDVGSITLTVGSGGAGSASRDVIGTSGSYSQLGPYVAVGGGGGGSLSNVPSALAPSAGGSGGGGAGYTGSPTGGAAITAQGFAGGTGTDATIAGGGGGGASAVGAPGSAAAGNGGAGVASSIDGSSVTRGGGGGGGIISGTAGTGGSGGGGAGGSSTGTAGTINTGGGGGAGGTSTSTAGNGGSGQVIVVIG